LLEWVVQRKYDAGVYVSQFFFFFLFEQNG